MAVQGCRTACELILFFYFFFREKMILPWSWWSFRGAALLAWRNRKPIAGANFFLIFFLRYFRDHDGLPGVPHCLRIFILFYFFFLSLRNHTSAVARARPSSPQRSLRDLESLRRLYSRRVWLPPRKPFTGQRRTDSWTVVKLRN